MKSKEINGGDAPHCLVSFSHLLLSTGSTQKSMTETPVTEPTVETATGSLPKETSPGIQ